jgi:putative ABC transport system substrate-binding protein
MKPDKNLKPADLKPQLNRALDLATKKVRVIDKRWDTANGTPVSELPVEQPTRFELIVDLRAARMLGVDLPVSVLSRADEVME